MPDYAASIRTYNAKMAARGGQTDLWMRRLQIESTKHRNDASSAGASVGPIRRILSLSASREWTRLGAEERRIVAIIEAWEYLPERAGALFQQIDTYMNPNSANGRPLQSNDLTRVQELVNELDAVLAGCVEAET